MFKKLWITFSLVFLFISTVLFACGGSCLECHPKLEPYIQDKDHIVLNECTTCHDKPSENGMCGEDCFDCHSKEKIYAQIDVQPHQELKKCVACHEEKPDFIKPKQSKIPSQNNTLIDIIK